MKIESIKKKVFVLYIIVSISLLVLGAYSWKSLQQLTFHIKEFSRPNAKSNLFNEITTNLYKLNNLYLTYSATYQLDTIKNHHALTNDIKGLIGQLQKEYGVEDSLAVKSLGEIPLLLDSIQTEYFEVHQKKKESHHRFINKLENELKKEINEFLDEDPIYIIKSITSEILLKESLDSVYFQVKEPSKNRKLFGSLFKKQDASPKDSLIVAKNIQQDTITGISMDTIASKTNTADITLTIENIFNNLYMQELENLNRLLIYEKSIYSKNSNIIHRIERRIHDFRSSDAKMRENMRHDLYAHSHKMYMSILCIISFFVIASLIFLYLIIRDIKKNHFYQNQLLRNEEKAVREAEAKQKFLAMMSHELRTPLTSIIGYADLLDDQKEYARAIKSSSSNLLHVANEILDMSKIIAGNIEIQLAPVNIKDFFNDIRRNFEILNIKEEVMLIFDLPEEDVVINTDGVRLYQVIYNLLHNAHKFTLNGFIKLSVETTQINEGKVNLKVEIEDSGIGIKKEDQNRIFEDYNQAGTHKDNMKGSGLGLGIVKELVQRLGGTLDLKSQWGKGTCFSLGFIMEVGEELPQVEPSVSLNQKVFDNIKMLCIDDDRLITKLYKNILEAYGAEVAYFNDPAIALYHLMENDYDLVITDIKMPGISGGELLHRLELAGRRPAKIIAATANILLSERDKNKLKRFDGLIIKPVTKNEMLWKVAKALEIDCGDLDKKETDYSKYEKNKAYDLSELKRFAMNDDELFREIIEEIITENKKELLSCRQSFKAKDYLVLGESIHKLTSRFRQIKVNPPFNEKEIESILLSKNLPKNRQLEQLLSYWQEVNDHLEASMGSLKNA